MNRQASKLTILGAASVALLVGLGAPALAQPADPPANPGGVDATSQDQDKPWAKGVSPQRQREAGALFEQGSDLLRDLLFSEALAKYEQAIAIWDHPAIRYRMARALYNLGNILKAHENLDRALAYGQAPLDQKDYRQALRFQKVLGAQLAHIEVVCDEPGAEVVLDGQPMFTGPGRETRVVVTGRHEVVARKDGYVTATRPVQLDGGQRESIEIKLLTFDQATVTRRRWPAWVPWTVVGAGAAVGLLGGVFRWRAGVTYEEYATTFSASEEQGGCSPSGCEPGEEPRSLRRLDNRGELYNGIGITGLIVGGVGVAAGIALVIVNQPKRVRAESLQPLVAPIVTDQEIGIMAGWRF